MIDHQRKLLFVHIARTGGTSIEAALVGCDWWEIDPDTKHLSASQMRRHYGDEFWDVYTKFTVIRNPWDRLVSMWATGWWHADGATPESVPFQEFLQSLRPHASEQYQSLHYHEVLDEPIDRVLRFERLASDFADLMRDCGDSTLTLPHRERRDRRHYRDYFDDASREFVAEHFAEDITRFGYSF